MNFQFTKSTELTTNNSRCFETVLIVGINLFGIGGPCIRRDIDMCTCYRRRDKYLRYRMDPEYSHCCLR